VRAMTRSSQRGMSLIEVIVGLLLLSLIVIAFLGILDSFSRVAKVQGNIADATENLRYSVGSLVRLLRMAGTGGLPLVHPDAGGNLQPLAIVVDDNVDGSSTYQFGGRTALAGTDVLRVRGVVVGELYDIIGATAVDLDTTTLVVPAVSPYSGNAQILTSPSNPEDYPIMIALQSPLDIRPGSGIGGVRHYNNYRIVQAGSSDPVTITGSAMTIDFVGSGSVSSLNPGGSFTSFQTNLAYAAGFLDDMVFFIANNASGEPSLYRFLGSGNAEELVPNIANMQVALGCDVNRDGELAAGEFFCSSTTPGSPSGDQFAALREVRLSIAARSQDPDLNWGADPDMPENAADLSGSALNFRYRIITVRIALRSHPPLEAG